MNNWKKDHDNLCFICEKPLSPQAQWGVGLTCWKKEVQGCPCHGQCPSWWEKGQLLIKCPDCAKENSDDGIRVVWDRNAKKEVNHE